MGKEREDAWIQKVGGEGGRRCARYIYTYLPAFQTLPGRTWRWRRREGACRTTSQRVSARRRGATKRARGGREKEERWGVEAGGWGGGRDGERTARERDGGVLDGRLDCSDRSRPGREPARSTSHECRYQVGGTKREGGRRIRLERNGRSQGRETERVKE